MNHDALEDNSLLLQVVRHQLTQGVRRRLSDTASLTVGFRRVKERIIEIMGVSLAVVLFNSLGASDAEKLHRELREARGQELQHAAERHINSSGLGWLKFLELEEDRPLGRAWALSNIDDRPVIGNGEGAGIGCYYIRGFLQRLLELAYGQRPEIHETQCSLHGAGHCEFVFGPSGRP